MDVVIAWCGFVGAWLLVAAPIYQAALELQEQDIERERIQETLVGWRVGSIRSGRRCTEVRSWWGP